GLLAYELGELCERRLGDDERALEAYRRALELDPTLRANVWALRRLLYRRRAWAELVKLIDIELDQASDGERAALLLERAIVAGHDPTLESQAREALETAVRAAPHDQRALLVRGGSYRSFQRHPRL